jgi:hypothetical protein
MASPIQSLLDRQSITEVLYLYCRACDRRDEVLLRACFHPDARHRHGGFAGLSSEFATMAIRIIGRAQVTKHVLTNVMIEVDGDRAWAESHYSAFHRFVDPETGRTEDNFSGGRYLDCFESRDGRWRIAERIGLLDYERFLPASERGAAQLPPEARSRRLGEDGLYEILGLERSRALP